MISREAEALAPLAPYPSLLLAVSGGPDSVALMLLAARWRDRAAHEIAVATVDHGLRAGSRAEARKVGEWARAEGFAHHLIVWRGEKPKTRIQERARDARYALLAGCARKIGASAIVTAHHADDQAETILFRLTRGSGVAGLSGMSPVSRHGEVALLRPLLDWRKSELEELCRSAGHAFVVDPSNANEDFARARLRRLRPLLAAQGFADDALLRLGRRAARADAALERCADGAAERALLARETHCARFDAQALRELPLEILLRLFAREISRLAPQSPPRLERLERVAQRLSEALARSEKVRITIADLLLEARGAYVTLKPAPPRRQKRD